jgi:hypothetical protein
VERSCEHGNEPSDSINVDKFLSSCITASLMQLVISLRTQFINRLISISELDVTVELAL